MISTYCIQVNGRVQGVGFRPHVYNLALKFGLFGTVSNNDDGVSIYVNTSKDKAKAFLETIIKSAPKVSIITDSSITESAAKKFSDFKIIASESKGLINIPLTPDFGICNNCRSELDDPRDKRFNYPFTTCVICGPRYAVTTKFPFERAHTTVSAFEMCRTCEAEYTSPTDRRFHSQTNTCSDCGIQLKLMDASGDMINENQDEIIDVTAKLLLKGQIIALKNTNGYLLCCDASNKEVIQKLRARKQRPNKPFAVIFPSIDLVKNAFQVSLKEEKELSSEVAPIVILENKEQTGIATKYIAPLLNQTGVMLPHTALLHLILKRIGKPIVATSGNIHGLPIISNEKDAQEQLGTVADYFVHHNLDISFPQDDSVVKFIDNQRIILRRSRGLAPNNVAVKTGINNVLATGADIKSAFAIAKKEQTYISQYFGSLSNYEVLKRYTATLSKFTEIFSFEPTSVLVDKHSNYNSAQLGNEIADNHKVSTNAIQHHKAHFSAVLGEHQLFHSNERILGVIWDGTGYGDDKQIWGGEFFEYHNYRIKRLMHFEYFNWIANDKMANEPRLSLFSLLDKRLKGLIASKFSKTEWQVYSKMLQTNRLKTSSVGRLFDAVASALELADFNTYEAEASMQLEQCASRYLGNKPINFLKGVSYKKVPTAYILNEIFKRYQDGFDKTHLAYSFIYTLAKCITRVAIETNIQTLACSGGVFQNSILVKMLLDSDLNIKLHEQLSPNDENIAFGQLQFFQHIKDETNAFSNSGGKKGHYIPT